MDTQLHLPKYVQEVIERIAFAAREDKKIDKRSGVSQRLPISAMENVISNAERRAIRNGREDWWCRASATSTPRCPPSPASWNWNTKAR